MQRDHVIQLCLKQSRSTLYDIGYLCIDLYQLSVFCELFTQHKQLDKIRFFTTLFTPAINQYNKQLAQYHAQSPRLTIQYGPIELLLSATTLLSSIIIPFTIMRAQRTDAMKQQNIQCDISVDDEEIQHNQIAYEKGECGNDEKALNMLFAALKSCGYDVQIRGTNIYTANKVTDKYARRTVRTLTRHC